MSAALQAMPATTRTEDLHLLCSRFADLGGAELEQYELTWSALCTQLAHPKERASKKACPLLKLATFGEAATDKGSLRHDGNVLEVFGIEGDYDGEQVSIDQAADKLASLGVAAFVYSSPSHTPERPRWRVLAPLSTPCVPSKRRHYVGLLNAALGGLLSAESFTLSQCFYVGKVKGTEYATRQVPGAPIDQALDLVLEPLFPVPTKERTKKDAPSQAEVDELDRAAAVAQADRHTLAELASALRTLDPDRPRGWIDDGQALASLKGTPHEEAARRLWIAHIQRGTKHQPEDGDAWERLQPDRTDYRAIFARASAAGWVNPRKGAAPKKDAPPTTFEVVPAFEFAAGEPPTWLVEDVLPATELAVVYGEPGCGKSFLVLDLARAIVTGNPWRGLAVRRGRVVYVAAEASGGVRLRLRALAAHLGVDLQTDLGGLGIVAAAPNLLTDDDQALAAAIELAGGAALIIIDTLAQATPGANENAGEDMGAALGRCRRLHEATGAAILLVHHSGKDASKGARGWSGLRGAVDAEIEVSRFGEHRTAKVTKQKDGEDGLSFGFRLVTVNLGTRPSGKPITSCVVEHVDQAPPTKREPHGVKQRTVYKAALELLGIDAEVPVATLLDAAVLATPHDPAGGRDRRREKLKVALDSLVESAFLRTVGDAVCMP